MPTRPTSLGVRSALSFLIWATCIARSTIISADVGHAFRLAREIRACFSIKSVKSNSRSAAYSQQTFCEAWGLTIQRYGNSTPGLVGVAFRAFFDMVRTAYGTCLPPLSSRRPAAKSRQAMRSRIRLTRSPHTTDVFCLRIRRRWPRSSSIRSDGHELGYRHLAPVHHRCPGLLSLVLRPVGLSD